MFSLCSSQGLREMSAQDAGEPRACSGLEAEIDTVLAEFGGDARRAIGALLHDLAVLAADSQANISRWFTRGRTIRSRRSAQRAGER